jgi:hypothetical protein
MSPGGQMMIKGPDALGTTENSPGAQYMKTGHDALRTTETMKTSSGGQNMKTLPDTLISAEIESGSAKHENGTRRSRYRRKGV